MLTLPKTGEFWYRMQNAEGEPCGFAHMRIEEGEGGRTVRIADLSAGEVRTALLPGAPLAEPGVSGGSGVCAAAGDSGAVLCLVDPGNGEATAIGDCPAYSAGPWCSGERIAWAERDREGTSVLLREREGTRILRIARSVPGIETAAFSGSVFVWIDAGDPGAVRGVRVRWPGPRVPPRCAAALGFRFEGSWVSAERVRIGWCFREDPGEGSYALFRARRAAAIPESTEVARGVLAGRGPYFLDDDRIPAPGPEEDVRYWLLLERTGAVEMVGPVEVRWPERPAEAALLPDGPNPARGSVRFVLTVPPGKGEGALTLQVYDGRGRLVSRAVALRAGSGRVPVVWDGRDRSGRRAPAGIYFLRVRMGSRVFPARKVVLL